MEPHAVNLFILTERVFGGGAVIGSVTKGINCIDTTYGSGAECAI
jgi:hypothetical protein